MIPIVLAELCAVTKTFGTGTWGVGNKRTNGDHPNYSIVEMSRNTEKSPGNSWRLVFIQTPVKNTPHGINYTATCLPSRKLSKLDEPDMQDTAGEARTNSSEARTNSYGPQHMAKQKQDDQLGHTYSSYVRIRDVALKTCQKRWMIGRSGERGSGISV